jgi:hypothetical protein
MGADVSAMTDQKDKHVRSAGRIEDTQNEIFELQRKLKHLN